MMGTTRLTAVPWSWTPPAAPQTSPIPRTSTCSTRRGRKRRKRWMSCVKRQDGRGPGCIAGAPGRTISVCPKARNKVRDKVFANLVPLPTMLQISEDGFIWYTQFKRREKFLCGRFWKLILPIDSPGKSNANCSEGRKNP